MLTAMRYMETFKAIMFLILILVVVATQVHKFVKNHQAVQIMGLFYHVKILPYKVGNFPPRFSIHLWFFLEPICIMMVMKS